MCACTVCVCLNGLMFPYQPSLHLHRMKWDVPSKLKWTTQCQIQLSSTLHGFAPLAGKQEPVTVIKYHELTRQPVEGSLTQSYLHYLSNGSWGKRQEGVLIVSPPSLQGHLYPYCHYEQKWIKQNSKLKGEQHSNLKRPDLLAKAAEHSWDKMYSSWLTTLPMEELTGTVSLIHKLRSSVML